MSEKKEEKKVPYHVAGLYIEEFFPFEKKTYGVLKSIYNDKFCRFVVVTAIRKDGYDWMGLNPTLENAVKFFYEEKKNKKK